VPLAKQHDAKALLVARAGALDLDYLVAEVTSVRPAMATDVMKRPPATLGKGGEGL
jgi:hypothetical protein